MKIADIRVINGDQPRCQIPLVEVETDTGLIGIGATQAPVKPIAALIADIAPLLLGQDPTSPNRLWRTMNEGWQAQRGRGGEGGMAINAMATIDMALWDLTGKAHNVPVHKLMGGAVKDRIMAYPSATAYDYTGSLKNGCTTWKTPAQLATESRAYVEEGFKAIKFGWANRFTPADLEGLAAVREAIGPDIRLMLDFGCPAYHDDGWTVKQALDVVKRLEPYDLYFFEEALHPYDVEGFARLTAGTRTRIATGESLVTQRDFDRFIDGRAVDVIQPDAKQIGMTVFQRVARHAEAADATYTADQRAAFLGQCDFVVIAVPVTPATEGMIDAAFLGEMKSSAYLIDCSGRSVLFDYPALVEAITGQTIAGASLQPSGASAELRCPPADDPFWERPNVIVTPCRGTSVQTNDKARNLIFDNFRRLDSGEPLLGLVDKVAGY